MRYHALPLCSLALCLSACLENEEEITIRPDGSSTLTVRANGPEDDLSDGHPLPLAAPWRAMDEATLSWLWRRGGDTTSADLRARNQVTSLDPASADADPDAEVEHALAVTADFKSVDAWPRTFAPSSEPYRTAFLERDAKLTIQAKGARTVYTFERTFSPRAFERFDPWNQIELALPEELRHRLDNASDEDELSMDERKVVVDTAVEVYPKALLAFADAATLADFEQGEASLSASAPARVHAAVREDLSAAITRERIATILDLLLAEDEDRAGAELALLEHDARAALRESLEQALQAEGLSRESRNAIRAELEWHLTAYDHTLDLGDESFAVTVRMPGTVVGGNFEKREGDAVLWSFEGHELHDRPVVLRVVSVLE